MRLLFLDDDPKRTKQFTANMVGNIIDSPILPGVAISYLITRHILHSEEADATLSPYDAVFLDYDMDEEHTGCNGYGSDVTEWLARDEIHKHFLNTLFVIHSLNEEGRRIMLATLKTLGLKAVELPFAWNLMTPDKLTDLINTTESEQQCDSEQQ